MTPLVGRLWLCLCLAQLALCWSPTDSYAPGNISCPGDVLVRDASDISDHEKSWMKGRHDVTDEALIEFLQRADMDDFDAEDFIKNKANRSLNIGLAFSGGGYRAMLSGAGELSALDNRTEGADKHGLGGLLQASSYLAGLSGGNWLVGTIAFNNFTSVQKILDDGEIWDLEHSIVDYAGLNIIKATEYYYSIYKDLKKKEDAGFETSVTDTWGRALSHQFFSTTSDNGASMTWSSIRDWDVFTEHQMPFPVVVADGRHPGQYIISGNSTIFEINPYELGSWDPSLYSFSDIKYLGTSSHSGKSIMKTCVGGFDNAGFIMGTSSSLFNQFILQINTTHLPSYLVKHITSLLQKVSEHEDDIAIYEPNPFFEYETDHFQVMSNNESLFLVDGGEDNQNIPLYPLLAPHRGLDVIFAFDNSADTDENWPNGTSMAASYERQFLHQGNGTVFPYVPDVKSFINLNLTSRPAFFGCDAKNLSSLLDDDQDKSDVYDTPLLVYIANRPFTYWSNTSTFKLSYEEDQKRGMIKNGFEVASRLNLTLDDEWPACVGCAIIRREQERLGIEQSDQCKECFKNYCWNGDIDTSKPGVNFVGNGVTGGEGNVSISGSGGDNGDSGNDSGGDDDNGGSGKKHSSGYSLVHSGHQQVFKVLMGAILSTLVLSISF